MNVAYLTNMPPPYRIPLFKRLQGRSQHTFHFIFCAEREGNRNWKVDMDGVEAIFLSQENNKTRDGYNYIHNNLGVFNLLRKLEPNIVLVTGLNPTMLYAVIYCIIYGKKLVYMTDGNIDSERTLSLAHRLLRAVVFKKCGAFIAMSHKGEALFHSYLIPDERIFRSQLCVDNSVYGNKSDYKDRDIDLLFCGQLHERKMPLFFLEVVREVSRVKPIKAVIIGDGPLKEAVVDRASTFGGVCTYIGSLQPKEIIPYYSRSKLLCFPTKLDPWGMVANEAMASGVPVITTPYAGVAGELIIDGVNGFVLEPSVINWTAAIIEILNDSDKWQQFSQSALSEVQKYNYDEAEEGILKAIDYA